MLLQYDKELFVAKFQDADGEKKYFIDLKEKDSKEKYVNISERSNGKKATILVDMKDLSMFTSNLLVAYGGEMVGTLKTEWNSFDFKKVRTDQGSHVIVCQKTENSESKYKVILTSETVPDIIIALVKIDAEISSKLKMSGNKDCEDDKPKSITLRTIMTGPEAGSIIGRGGEVVNYIKSESGAKISMEGASQERIISVDGPTDSIFKAYTLICKTLEGRERRDSRDGPERTREQEEGLSLNLLVPSSQCGALIGKEGSKITEIREFSGATIHVSGEPLPGSSETSVKVSGSREEVTECIYHICCTLLEYPPKGEPRLYRPDVGFDSMSLPNDVVGAVIGKRGAKINEIRQISGATINIRKKSTDTDREMIIEISGSTTAVTLAKSLINEAMDMVGRFARQDQDASRARGTGGGEYDLPRETINEANNLNKNIKEF
jgi:transcription antitermination factor NusA-like protein